MVGKTLLVAIEARWVAVLTRGIVTDGYVCRVVNLGLRSSIGGCTRGGVAMVIVERLSVAPRDASVCRFDVGVNWILGGGGEGGGGEHAKR